MNDTTPTPMVICPVKRGGWLSWLIPQRIYTGNVRFESYDFKVDGDVARSSVTLVPVGPVSREWRLFMGAFGTGGVRVWPLWRKAR